MPPAGNDDVHAARALWDPADAAKRCLCNALSRRVYSHAELHRSGEPAARGRRGRPRGYRNGELQAASTEGATGNSLEQSFM